MSNHCLLPTLVLALQLVFPVKTVQKAVQHRTLNLQRSCLFNEIIAFWSLIVTFSHIAILVFPSPNLRPLEIIIKTFLYNLRLFKALILIQLNLRLFKTPRKPCYNWIYKTCPSKARPFSNLYIQYKRTTVEFTWNKPTGIACIKAFYWLTEQGGTLKVTTTCFIIWWTQTLSRPISNNQSSSGEPVYFCQTWHLLAENESVTIGQGSSNLSLEGQSAAEFSSNPDQTHLSVIF